MIFIPASVPGFSVYKKDPGALASSATLIRGDNSDNNGFVAIIILKPDTCYLKPKR